MKEGHVRFLSGDCKMEGLYHPGHPTTAAVITHPHPLYGGDMYNPVVEAIATAYQKIGFATLRFNFRGTGKSTGTHDQGLGEKTDVVAAVAFLKADGFREIHLSGYSFGAWVNAMAVQAGLSVQGFTMVAPPVAFINFKDGLRLPMLSAVVAGSRDEFAPPDLIHPCLGQWNPDARLDIIDGADHFFFGFLDEVVRRLVQHTRPIP
ncbi:alpha/beta hydrolase [Desulfosarcina alkanivorans]|uniref:Alpha/beta hydrolase n=1 Tax=Desulfosarcina alkanivorans TaxID=571177 RepID=A0A5K7YRI2_9BACT|nr:alpha/beta fold hydrolase [Desulfosarcina alkanivorans]BBO70519.1 alpha/beta hydrolase [Desulfosarcina alkanivorans]